MGFRTICRGQLAVEAASRVSDENENNAVFFFKAEINKNTSNWTGIGFLVGSDRTVVHFFLSCELTSTTRLSLVHLSPEGD